GVFIPRPETESLVELAMGHLPDSGGIVVDVGTGSGAIALSIAHERPDARVFATEIDTAALAWAERNREATGEHVTFVRADLFDGLPGELQGKVDVVVSNPPYVATSERDVLPVDVRDHEPERALFAGEDGLDVIARLLETARDWLRPDGWLVLEIGERQAPAALDLVSSNGYADGAVHNDFAGKPRFIDARHAV
nr:peptide chain release factor N(5)-glutamine methyltransferase [Actinomycetota bacterium]